ncbi:VOC family protein [Amycolatopsis rhabdoformis]|uniref:VOC family protein n=1 Tax=Amycolatopsis rhabdoformis TaxID=1448059 RepID=A0ABZ1I9S0_9PSEU|nr:VOC family protein [Amycolatopsis rhabdoformis]WSE30693.1 VOC family protein [Amycolatopsis rhabdoformis]
MTIVSLTVDAARPEELAEFWAALLGWRQSGASVQPTAEDGCEFGLYFVRETAAKSHKNRLHLDLASHTPANQREIVAHAQNLGARPLDLGQGDVPWVVLADPEGNEFCVLEPRPEYATTGALAALVVDSRDPGALAAFWSVLIGWPVTSAHPQITGLRSASGRGPAIEFLLSKDSKHGPNRVRPALRLPGALAAAADPEGNEYSTQS